MKTLSFTAFLLLMMLAFSPLSYAHFQPYEETDQYTLVCNGGELAVRYEVTTDSYTLYLYEKDAIFYFIDRSKEIGPGTSVDYQHALQVMVPYRLPDDVQYYAELDGAVLWINGMQVKAGGRRFTSYEYGPGLKQVANGYELTLSGVVQTQDNGLVYYRLGTRFFGNCVLNL